MTPQGVTLRRATASDQRLLRRLYASTRDREMSLVPWTPQEKDAFVEMQFLAQDQHYHAHYPNGSFDVLELEGVAIGRLYVDPGATDIRIIDIALLPEHRGRGLGSLVIRQVLDEASASGRTVSIHVALENPARRLYKRLGFVEIEQRGPDLLMQCTPDPP